MRAISGVLRVVSGFAVLGIAFHAYRVNAAELAADHAEARVEYLGKPLPVGPLGLRWMIAGAGVVGAALVGFGLATLLRAPARPAQEQP